MTDIGPLVRLAANAVPGDRKYVLLAGAGLSKDAGQPTAWDIVLETAKLLRAATGDDDSGSIADWFNASPYAESSYADMISALYPNSSEQQAFLDRQLVVKKPGRAHVAIAELCHRGVLRAIITTNFDALTETALRERGIEPQVIAGDHDFKHVAPLIHCPTIRVYKPHGTLGSGTLRNTPADVEKLPPVVSSELLRVFDDHGLIVLGYAGADGGMMTALRKRRKTLYPVYWLHFEDMAPAPAEAACGETLVRVRISGASLALENLITIQDRLARLQSTGAMIDPAPAIEAIVTGRKDAPARIRDFMDEFAKGVVKLSPHGADLDSHQNPDCDEVFIKALDATRPLVLEYSRIAAKAAEHDSIESCLTVRTALHLLGRLYAVGSPEASADFVRFLEQEMFVILISFLIKNDRWATIKKVLHGNMIAHDGSAVSWKEFNPYIRILDEYRKQRRGLNRISVAHDIYHERHSGDGRLAEEVPFADLEDADWFLTFITAFAPPAGEPSFSKWYPRISLSTRRLPLWFAKMRSRSFAFQILSLMDMGILSPSDMNEREALFRQHLEAVRSINRQVWRGGYLDPFGRFHGVALNDLFADP